MSRLASLLPLIAVLACSDGNPTDPNEEPGQTEELSVVVEGVHAPLPVGSTAQLHAALVDEEGDPVAGATITWSTTAPQVVEVDESGVVVARSPGSATIRASAQGKTGTLPIEVTPAPSNPGGSRGRIAYLLDDELRTIEPDGTGDRLVWALEDTIYRISAISWRPDGSEIAFASNHEMAYSFFERDIYAVRPDGSGLRKITNAPLHAGRDGKPRGTVTVTVSNLTFDGGPYFVYVEGAPEPKMITLGAAASTRVTFTDVADFGDGILQPAVVVNGIFRWWDAAAAVDVRGGQSADAGTITIGANPIEHFGADAPFWRGDGGQVGYIGIPTCLLQRVPASPPAGPVFDPLLDPGVWGSTCAADWSPAPGKENELIVADASDYTETGETHIRRTTVGSTVVPAPVLTVDDYAMVVDLRWLPDGSGFLYARQDGLLEPEVNLYEYLFATGTVRKITDLEGAFVRGFSVSPDGEWIVYEHIAGGEFYDLLHLPSDLRVMRRDGSGDRLLVRGGRAPAW